MGLFNWQNHRVENTDLLRSKGGFARKTHAQKLALSMSSSCAVGSPSGPSTDEPKGTFEVRASNGFFCYANLMKATDPTGKVSLSETYRFDKNEFYGQVFVSNEENVGFNALLVTINGRHPKKRMIDTIRIYYVTGGEGTFVLDKVEHQAKEGDLFIIGPGHKYEYFGNMKLFEFNVSPENSFKDQVLE